MKAILLLLISMSVYSAHVPKSWVSEQATTKSNDFNPSQEFDKYLGTLLTVQENILTQADTTGNKAWGPWKLSAQKTDLAISKSGLFGFSSVKGTQAVELSWSKTSNEDKSDEVNPVDLALDSSMDEETVLKTVRPSFKMLFKNSKSQSYGHFQKNMEDHIIRYHRALKGVSSLQEMGYTPKKFRLDLSTSFSSPLFGFTKLSGDTRMRLEWKITANSQKNTTEEDQEVVRKIMVDLTKALESADTPKDYKLKEISIGLGLSQKNLLSFSKVKGEIVGELYFKKNSKKLSHQGLDLEGDYQWNRLNDQKFLNIFKRRKFRKGIEKAFSMTNWFASKFDKRTSSWEISKFKTAFSISYSGFLGLSNTSSKSLVTFTFSK